MSSDPTYKANWVAMYLSVSARSTIVSSPNGVVVLRSRAKGDVLFANASQFILHYMHATYSAVLHGYALPRRDSSL